MFKNYTLQYLYQKTKLSADPLKSRGFLFFLSAMCYVLSYTFQSGALCIFPSNPNNPINDGSDYCLNFLNEFISPFVDASCEVISASFSNSGNIFFASCLPSSTPH